MRKSRRHNISKKTKKHKFSRKMKKGGMMEDHSGYILVGYHKSYNHGQTIPPLIPLFLQRNKNGNSIEMQKLVSPNPMPEAPTTIILSQLYKTKYRNLDFKNFFPYSIVFVNEDEIPITPSTYNELSRFVVRRGAPFDSTLPQINNYIDKNKEQIKEIELKYPGLFQRMFVTEEEERQALEEIQRQYNENDNNIELKVQELERQLQQIQSMLQNEKLQKKEYVTQPEELEFMEFTNRITPYLRNDLKEKRKNKISRKVVDDENVTIGTAWK